jgi:hypothetical protein
MIAKILDLTGDDEELAEELQEEATMSAMYYLIKELKDTIRQGGITAAEMPGVEAVIDIINQNYVMEDFDITKVEA